MKKIMLFAIVTLISAGVTFITIGQEAKEITLTGKVAKAENEPGKVSYTLTDADGNVVNLPPSKETPHKYKLDKFDGKNVKVVGKATINEKGGKKEIVLEAITTIEEVK